MTLWDAFQSWGKLTEQEGSAIQKQDWPMVTRCQQAKAQLQIIISALEQAMAPDFDPEEKEKLKTFRDQLLELEHQNLDSLRAQRQIAEQEDSELHLQSRNLKRVQKSYSAPMESGWRTYS